MSEAITSKPRVKVLVLALLASFAVLGWREVEHQRSSRALDAQVQQLTQNVSALTEEVGASRGRLELARSDTRHATSPEVLAALVAQKLEQTQHPGAPAAKTAASEPEAARQKVDPVALAAANDVVDSAIESGHWDRKHQVDLSTKLAALHSEDEAREVAARVAVAINHGQLIPDPLDAHEE